MAATFTTRATVTPQGKPGDDPKSIVFGTVTLDASYPTGGESLTAAILGLGSVDHVVVGNASAVMYFPYWVPSTGKLLMGLEASGGDGAVDEVANTTDLSAVTVEIMAVGRPA